MKHIKIFEEFTPEEKPQFDKHDLTQNEINLLEHKTQSKLYKNQVGEYYLLGTQIDKMSDGFWLLNETTQCSSIQDVINYCITNSDNAKDWFQKNIINHLQVTNNKYAGYSDYTLNKCPINIDNLSFYTKALHINLNDKTFYFFSEIMLHMGMEFNINSKYVSEIILQLLSKHFNMDDFKLTSATRIP